jgi:C1A family cysteine protease
MFFFVYPIFMRYFCTTCLFCLGHFQITRPDSFTQPKKRKNMPIRFDDGGDNGRNNGSGQGGKGGIIALLALLFFFWRFPKFTIFVLLIAGGVYFLYNNPDFAKKFGLDVNQTKEDIQNRLFGLGCDFDQKKYDATEVYEPLASNSSKNSRPSRYSLRNFAPRRGSQGQQGSCVGWASAYAARTILEAAATGKDPNRLIYSPSFLYNQIRVNDRCEGSILADALRKMKNDGLVYLADFPYDESSCSRNPSSSLKAQAQQHRIRGYQRLTQSGDNYDVDLEAVKQNIAQNGPVIIAMNVPSSFDRPGKLWEPRSNERRNPSRYGGHAMCLIGYDDNYQGGAFEIMNSWGANWGDGGCVWVRYEDFKQFCREAFGIYPPLKANPTNPSANTNELAVGVGIVEFPSGKNVRLGYVSGQTFAPNSRLAKNSKFRVEVSNDMECYVYIFGQETDGSSYVLFPYTDKNSPFCGITGTRHFPKDGMESLRVDDVGNRDFMAVVVSRKPLDYKALNNQINSASGSSYEQKVLRALGRQHFKNVRINVAGTAVQFRGKAQNDNENAVAFILQVDK